MCSRSSRREKQHQPNDWIIEWPYETACAAKQINKLHHSPLGIHCYSPPAFQLLILYLASFSFPLLLSGALQLCHVVFVPLHLYFFLSIPPPLFYLSLSLVSNPQPCFHLPLRLPPLFISHHKHGGCVLMCTASITGTTNQCIKSILNFQPVSLVNPMMDTLQFDWWLIYCTNGEYTGWKCFAAVTWINCCHSIWTCNQNLGKQY